MMNETNFKKYAKLIKPVLKVDESLIEKDYILTLFLTNANKFLNEGKITHFKDLIFKGGTLLTKAYLDYHRISEDLDFTHKDSNEIRLIESKNLREKKIKE
ncbi:MAG: nucleotidyl transferase AbiEii/AbiGii toxin family protein, partial [Candidatus Nanoarchaeia archaeon]|nr:nucleotidyl transferase AbiEii/AbiGii toxin family protein [Candidatus Nanoarchaeia archaeon]